MDAASLRADCARCAALCCVALAFDRSAAFAIDKPNGVPCPHLDPDSRCAIYAEREAKGFPGCVGFDCLGAGQRVTQELFEGRSWRDDPALLAPMIRAFVAMRRVHELGLLLHEVARAPLSPDERGVLEELKALLEPAGGWSDANLAAFDDAAAGERVRGFLASLRGRFGDRPRAPATPPPAPR
jgi:hypothetical protein